VLNRRRSSGQALAILSLSVALVLAATAVVIDGGNAMAQQRGTQNAADAAALAGALVIAEKMGGATRDDSDVETAMQAAFSNNDSDMMPSYYVSFAGGVVGTVGSAGSIPSAADGIEAAGERVFDTFLASIAGQPTWTASAQATALAGSLRGLCSAADGCGVMPVTFSIPITSCDGTNRPLRIGIDWPLVSLEAAMNDSSGQYESIVPLCKNGPGGVGWLDMSEVWQGGDDVASDCTGNLAIQISNPCNGPFDIPSWIHTNPGDVNSVEDELDNYEGTVITVPMFDATCRDVPSSGLPADCTDPGNGNNLWYHIPRFAKFLLDEVHVAGGNSDECNAGPGAPPVGGNGSTSCLKGWFVRYIMHGRVGEFQGCDVSDLECMEEPILGVQLVR
jgi:hypothetical protein